MPESLTARLLALQPDEELIVPCAGRLEWKLVQNRVHGIAQYIRQTRDAAFRVRTWGCTGGVGVERAVLLLALVVLTACGSDAPTEPPKKPRRPAVCFGTAPGCVSVSVGPVT
jgi:hypothetical protein